MSDTDYLGSERMEPEGYLKPTRYKIKARCERCGKVFSWIDTTPGGKNRPCPNPICIEARIAEEVAAATAKMAKMLEEQRAPAVIGQSNVVKAVDATAEIVMRDHGLTDLKDNIRQGDIMAPSLKGKGANGVALQQAADAFFTPAVPKGINRQMAARMNRRVAQVMRGGGIRVHPKVVAPAAQEGEAAVHRVRVEPNSGFKGS